MNYVWPRIRELPLQAAVRPILHLHLFRFIGLAFLVLGMVGVSLKEAFAAPATYGDLVAMTLAWIALILGIEPPFTPRDMGVQRVGFCRFFICVLTGHVGIDPASLAAAWFIPTIAVPLLLCSHLRVFARLMRTSSSGVLLAHPAR